MLVEVVPLPPSFPPSGTFYFINRPPWANISVSSVIKSYSGNPPCRNAKFTKEPYSLDQTKCPKLWRHEKQIEYWQHLSQNMIVASPFGFWYDPLYRGGCCWCPNEVEEHLNPPFEPLLLHCTAMLPDAIWFPPYAGLPHCTIGWKYFWSQAYLLVFFMTLS